MNMPFLLRCYGRFEDTLAVPWTGIATEVGDVQALIGPSRTILHLEVEEGRGDEFHGGCKAVTCALAALASLHGYRKLCGNTAEGFAACMFGEHICQECLFDGV